MAMTLNEIRREGLKALAEKLGPVGMVRFLQQFDTGQGDYTTEHQAWQENLDEEEFFKAIIKEQENSE